MEDKKIGARALHYPGLILILKKKILPPAIADQMKSCTA